MMIVLYAILSQQELKFPNAALDCSERTERRFYFPVVCADLIRGAKEKNLKVKGPVRMPTKVSRGGENTDAERKTG